MATYYVKTGGNDASAGTSDGTAWAHHPWMSTWTAAAKVLVAGDIVCMNRGDTWSINNPAAAYMTVAQSGTVGSPITTTWYGTGAKPIIKIATNTDETVISGYGRSYITFDNLEINHYDDTYTDTGEKIGIAFGDVSSNWIITNCIIHSCPLAGIYGSTTCYNITIGDTTATSCATDSLYSNNIYDCGYAAIVLHGVNAGRSDFNVYYNYIHDIDAHTVGDRDSYGIAFSVSGTSTGWPKYATARYNYIADIPGWTALDCHGGQYIYFLDNYVHNCHYGVNVQSVTSGALVPIADYIYIERNTIEHPDDHAYSSFWFIALHGKDGTYRATNSFIRDNNMSYIIAPSGEANSFGIKLNMADTVTISGNSITNGSAGNNGAIQVSGYAKNIIVCNNYIYNWNPAIYIIPGYIDGAISIYNNIVNSQNIPLYFDSGTIGTNTINIYNNTFLSQHSSDGYGIILSYSTLPASSVVNIKNNIIVFNSNAAAGSYIEIPVISGTFTCDYNLFWNSSYAGAFDGGTFATWQGLGYDANSLNATNPSFTNGGGSYLLDTDFTLQSGSLARGEGVDVDLLMDYLNHTVPATPDIGAYQYGASNYYTTYYVSNDGSDSNTGGTTGDPWEHHPWMTGWAGDETLTAGDTVCMNRGDIWNVSNPTTAYMTVAQSGTVGSPITTTWYGTGDKPHLHVVTDTSFPVILGYGKSYITFDNLEIVHYSAVNQIDILKSGIIFGKDASLNVPHNWIITNCTIHNCPMIGIANLDDAYNITIGDINATATATVSLYSNHIYDCGYCGVNLIGRNPATDRSDFNVYYNYIHDIDVPFNYANSYGIAFSSTNVGSGQLESTGWPRYTTARFNYIANVPNWEGIDSHGGMYGNVLDNYIYNCLAGITSMFTQNLTWYEEGVLDNFKIERNIIEAPSTLTNNIFIEFYGYDATHRVTNSVIRDNTCFYTTSNANGDSNSGIYLLGVDGVIVENNYIYNGPSVTTYAGGICVTGPDASAQCKNVIIRNNFIKDWGCGLSICAIAIDGNIEIYNNIVKSAVYRSIYSYSTSGNVMTAGNVYLYNNTFMCAGAGTWVLDFSSFTLSAGTSVVIKNNIICFGVVDSWGYYIVGPTHAAGTFTCDYNLYWNSSGPYFYGYVDGARTLAQWQALGFDINSPNVTETLDPSFVNGGGSYLLDTDFTIPTGSPAKNAGVDVDVPYDYWYNYRNVSTPDIGVHEYGATSLYGYQYVEYTDGVSTYRDGVRDTYYVIDKELNSFMGFDGTEDVDWENVYFIS